MEYKVTILFNDPNDDANPVFRFKTFPKCSDFIHLCLTQGYELEVSYAEQAPEGD